MRQNEKFSLFLVGLVAVGYGTFLILKAPFVQPHIKASAYKEPNGCTADIPIHDLTTAMPCSCADEKYKFMEADKYHFTYLGRRNNYFFRMGNDAVEISYNETSFNPRGICWKNSVVRNVFYQ